MINKRTNGLIKTNIAVVNLLLYKHAQKIAGAFVVNYFKINISNQAACGEEITILIVDVVNQQ